MPSSNKNEKRTAVHGLGEIAFRVNNLDAMQRFYEQVIGLRLMTRVPNYAFFKIADGYGGHTQCARLVRPIREPRLLRNARRNFHDRPHRIRGTSGRFRRRTEETGVVGASSRNR
jgi:catechol 2,3-dioxygenase-like lactoylglutathione lyase family enzyme